MAIRRFPKTGGPTVPFVTAANGFWTPARDVLFRYDSTSGNIVRFRSATDQKVVGRLAPKALTFASDGQSLYLATAGTGFSGIFRILE